MREAEAEAERRWEKDGLNQTQGSTRCRSHSQGVKRSAGYIHPPPPYLQSTSTGKSPLPPLFAPFNTAKIRWPLSPVGGDGATAGPSNRQRYETHQPGRPRLADAAATTRNPIPPNWHGFSAHLALCSAEGSMCNAPSLFLSLVFCPCADGLACWLVAGPPTNC